MDVLAYLNRIGAPKGPPSYQALCTLHRAHLACVPFENLDIPLGIPIQLKVPELFHKIVNLRRGGFCYELNGLFGWLLEGLGYRITMLEAGVYGKTGLGPPFDHMLLLVHLEETWLVDVGFGDSFIEPLRFAEGHQGQVNGDFRLVDHHGEWLYERHVPKEGWSPQYRFRTTPRTLAEFQPMCLFQQTSPASVFTQKSVCSRVVPAGRITFASGRLIETKNGDREERLITNQVELRQCLVAHFEMNLDPALDLAPLLVETSGADPRSREDQ